MWLEGTVKQERLDSEVDLRLLETPATGGYESVDLWGFT